MSIVELEASLRAARAREEKAIKALAPKHKGGEWTEYLTASEEVLRCERALSAAKGEEYAVPVDFPVEWDTGAPLPYLLQNDYRTFLVFFLRDIDPDWDGSYVNVRRPDSPSDAKLALVEFKHCVCTKMGTPNDEVYEGHPLNGKGFRGYAALRVENSKWIRELETINAVHSQYRPDTWRNLNHYIFGFHDSTFECVAEGFAVETCEVPLSELLAKVCGRLVG
jgi:hypothetical protein